MKIRHRRKYKRCRCLGINYTFEQWSEAIRTHPANTPVMTFQTIQTQFVQGNKLGDKISPYVGGDSRSIAEAYFDWWLSNQSFDEWFAQKYQQLSFDFSEKPKQLNTNE